MATAFVQKAAYGLWGLGQPVGGSWLESFMD
jgi:hypothetical protein